MYITWIASLTTSSASSRFPTSGRRFSRLWNSHSPNRATCSCSARPNLEPSVNNSPNSPLATWIQDMNRCPKRRHKHQHRKLKIKICLGCPQRCLQAAITRHTPDLATAIQSQRLRYFIFGCESHSLKCGADEKIFTACTILGSRKKKKIIPSSRQINSILYPVHFSLYYSPIIQDGETFNCRSRGKILCL